MSLYIFILIIDILQTFWALAFFFLNTFMFSIYLLMKGSRFLKGTKDI